MTSMDRNDRSSLGTPEMLRFLMSMMGLHSLDDTPMTWQRILHQQTLNQEHRVAEILLGDDSVGMDGA
jgi:hypothetical protein